MTISIRTKTSGRTYQRYTDYREARCCRSLPKLRPPDRSLAWQLPPAHEDDQPWTASPSRRNKEPPVEGPLPKSVEVVLGDQIYIDRSKLPPGLVTRIARLAAFQNPEFYTAQAMRLPTFGKPRVISCAELFSKHVALPRGCLDSLMGLLGSVGIAAELRDERQQGQPLAARFLGELTSE